MADGMTVKWDLQKFFSGWSSLKRRSGDAANFFVKWQSRRLLRSLAWHTPVAEFVMKVLTVKLITDRSGVTRYVPRKNPIKIRVRRGRARAGWKPAAAAIGVSTVYTKYPNQNEGGVIDRSNERSFPSVVMTNRVPYILTIQGHGDWAQNAINQEATRMVERLEKTYRERLVGFTA